MEGNAVVQSDVISTMIQTTISAQEAQRQDRAAKLAEYRKAMEVALHQELGEDLWTLLFPYMHADFHNEGRDSYVLYVFVYDAIPLQLAPFSFSIKNSRRWNWTSPDPDFTVMVSPEKSVRYFPVSQLGEVLAECRKQFPEWNRNRLDKLTAPLIYKLQNCIYKNQAQSPEQADAYLQQLLDLDPENAVRWQELRMSWAVGLLNHQKQEADAARQHERKEKELDQYGADLEAYCRAYLNTIAANRAKCQALQDHIAGGVTYWKMTFALLGEEEGERVVETNYAFVAAPDPDEHGYWSVYDRGSIRPVRYLNPVSVEGPMETTTADGPDSIIGHWFVADSNGLTLYYRPGLDIATVLKALDLQKVPDAPASPDVSYHWECERMDAIRAGLRQRLEAEGYEPDDLARLVATNSMVRVCNRRICMPDLLS